MKVAQFGRSLDDRTRAEDWQAPASKLEHDLISEKFSHKGHDEPVIPARPAS
ncbi:hypothetical protein GCM10011588_39470 [Nocardia jinanensis]|uniref:Uncharacterized protein n=1 Tax=Nocardia jinanensis TaxID=382504 RepID=A0A917VWC1_9NOCA|nr:hypothetical protein GCM10011588_39470 [Nocardia jinanensis]